MQRCRVPLTALTLALILALALPATADHLVVATQDVDLGGQLVRTDTTVEVDGEEVNRFQMHRMRKENQPVRGAVLLLPPLANPFAFFEADEHGDYQRSFAAFLALKGYEVWGYTPRGYQLALGDCESGAVDCAPMGGWGLAAVVEDATWIRGRIAAALPGVEPAVGGYSLGAINTIALLDAHPGDWAGGMILEGGLYSEDPVIRAINDVFCQGFEALLAGGVVFDGQTSATIRLIGQLAQQDPDGLTPLPGFPPGTTNHQVLVFLLAVPQNAPLSPTPDFVRCVGSFPDDEFTFCRDERIFTFTDLFLNYVDNRTLRDINCSLAGEATFTGGLGAYDGAVLLLGGSLGFGETDDDLEGLFTAADVTRVLIPGYGHADMWFSASHREAVETDVLLWLDALE